MTTYQGLKPRTVSEIQRKITRQGKRRAVVRAFQAKSDRSMIAEWRQDLNRILHVFNVRGINLAWRSLRVSLPDGAVDQ